MAAVKDRPTLDLSTLSHGEPIKIDGRAYEVRHPESLPLIAYKQLETELPRLGHLMVKAKLSKVEATEAEQLLRGVIDVILDAPEAVRAKLRASQCVLILDVFTKLRPANEPTPAEAKTTARRRTGGNSSRR